MSIKTTLTGNDAVAYGMKQINPDVSAAYPITPQTELMQKFAEYVANGEVKTEMILVESEHSAMSACIGGSAAGVRVMTATSSAGLAYMWELLYVAAGLRLPIVMPVVNRALSAPLNIHCDHSDSMGARDTGWIQIFAENTQEAYDNIIQAVLIAENRDVLLPVMTMLDGFIISHTMENLEVLEDDIVKNFIGEYKPLFSLLDTDKPVTLGAADHHDYYFEHRRQQIEGMENARKVIIDVADEYAKISGRHYGYFEEYKLSDAEIGVIALGSSAGTMKSVIDEARGRGIKVGLLKLRVFRPFPYRELADALKHLKALSVLDRSVSFGAEGGPVFTETKSALLNLKQAPKTINYIYGLGGRDVSEEMLRRPIDDMIKMLEGKQVPEHGYLGLRE